MYRLVLKAVLIWPFLSLWQLLQIELNWIQSISSLRYYLVGSYRFLIKLNDPLLFVLLLESAVIQACAIINRINQ